MRLRKLCLALLLLTLTLTLCGLLLSCACQPTAGPTRLVRPMPDPALDLGIGISCTG